jgi:hypothetical protein
LLDKIKQISLTSFHRVKDGYCLPLPLAIQQFELRIFKILVRDEKVLLRFLSKQSTSHGEQLALSPQMYSAVASNLKQFRTTASSGSKA